jgi:hypothetical protein
MVVLPSSLLVEVIYSFFKSKAGALTFIKVKRDQYITLQPPNNMEVQILNPSKGWT